MRTLILMLSLWSLPAAQAAQDPILVMASRVHPSATGSGSAVTLEMLVQSTCVVIDGIEANDPANPRPLVRQVGSKCQKIAERLRLTKRLPQVIAERSPAAGAY